MVYGRKPRSRNVPILGPVNAAKKVQLKFRARSALLIIIAQMTRRKRTCLM